MQGAGFSFLYWVLHFKKFKLLICASENLKLSKPSLCVYPQSVLYEDFTTPRILTKEMMISQLKKEEVNLTRKLIRLYSFK